MSKNMSEAERIINEGLADVAGMQPIIHDEEWQDKLQSLRDFEALAWFQVGHGKLTAWEAEDAITDFIIWLESGAGDNPELM